MNIIAALSVYTELSICTLTPCLVMNRVYIHSYCITLSLVQIDLFLSIPDFIQFIQKIRQPSMLATFQRTHPIIKFSTTFSLYPAYRPAAILRLTFWLLAADSYVHSYACIG